MVRVHSQVMDQVLLGDGSRGVMSRCPGDGRDGYFPCGPIDKGVGFLKPG